MTWFVLRRPGRHPSGPIYFTARLSMHTVILGVCVWAGQAENAVGVSPWSALCHSATSATVPGQPAPPCVVASTPTAAQVQWIAPADGGAELTEYLLECDDGCAAHQPRTSSHDQVLPYCKLTPRSALRCRVYVHH